MNLFTKQKQLTDIERNLWLLRGRMGEGIVRELGMVRYTLLYLKWMTKKPRKPLNVMWQAGWEGSFRENVYVYMYGRVPLLSTQNCHNIANWPYSSRK